MACHGIELPKFNNNRPRVEHDVIIQRVLKASAIIQSYPSYSKVQFHLGCGTFTYSMGHRERLPYRNGLVTLKIHITLRTTNFVYH